MLKTEVLNKKQKKERKKKSSTTAPHDYYDIVRRNCLCMGKSFFSVMYDCMLFIDMFM